jgi:hypothetical protein
MTTGFGSPTMILCRISFGPSLNRKSGAKIVDKFPKKSGLSNTTSEDEDEDEVEGRGGKDCKNLREMDFRKLTNGGQRKRG